MLKVFVIILDIVVMMVITFTTIRMLSERSRLILQRSNDVALYTGLSLLMILVLNFMQVMHLH